MSTQEKIENVLKNGNSIITHEELEMKSKDLKIPFYIIMSILVVLQFENKIVVSDKGVTWIYNENSKLKETLNEGREL